MKLKTFFLLLLAGFCGTLIATPKNSDFETGKRWKQFDIPQGWHAGFNRKASGTISLDEQDANHGKKSLKITNSQGLGYINVISQKTTIPQGTKQPLISIDIATKNTNEGKVVILCYDKSGKQVQWKSLFFVRGTKPWKRYSRRIKIPAEAVTYIISLRLIKAGTVWYDNLEVNFSGKAQPVTAGRLNINGTMEKSATGNLPVGWSEFHFPGVETVGTVTTASNVRNGKKSVKIWWESGASGFGIANKISIVAGQSYEFSAWGKTAGGGKLQIMVMAYDKGGDILMSVQSEELQSTAEWRKVTTQFTVPRKAVSLQLICLNKGTGEVWYDDAKLKPIAKGKIKAVFPISFGCEPATGNAIWNKWRPVFSTFSDSPGTLTFDFWGDKSKLKNPVFVIELPSAITIAECFNSHGNNQNPAMQPHLTDFIRNGKPWTRYSYLNPKAISMIKARPAFWRSISVLFKPNADYTEGKEFPASAYVVNNNQKSKVTNFYIKILPPMKQTPNPKKFYVHLWSNYDIAVTNRKLFKDILKRFEEAGMTGRTFNNWGREQLYEQDNLCRQRGWKMHFNFGGTLMKSTLKAAFNAPQNALDYKGKTTGHICPSALLSDIGQAALNATFIKQAKMKKMRDGDTVIFDYEPWQSHSWCFGPECRSRFSDFIGSSKVLSAAEIRKTFSAQWTKFRLRDTGAISAKLAQIVKNYNPSIKTADYDYPINFEQPGFESRFKSIPKDTRKSDKYLDAHFSSFYYTLGKQAFDMVDINRRELKKAFFMLPLLTRYTDPNEALYTRGAKCTLSPKRIRMTILNCATAGGSGQSFWTGTKIDAQYFLAIDRAMSEIAQLEDILANGKRVDKQVKVKLSWEDKTDPADSFRMRTIEYKGLYLLCIFNYHANRKIGAKLKFNPVGGDKWQVRNPISGKKYSPPSDKDYWTTKELENGINAVILPEDVKFIEITPR